MLTLRSPLTFARSHSAFNILAALRWFLVALHERQYRFEKLNIPTHFDLQKKVVLLDITIAALKKNVLGFGNEKTSPG
jgi:hypothetical protein